MAIKQIEIDIEKKWEQNWKRERERETQQKEEKKSYRAVRNFGLSHQSILLATAYK